MSNSLYEIIIEYILYKRDRNPLKDWWHIRGWTTAFSYCRRNREYLEYKKYEEYLLPDYRTDDIFINIINKWYNWNFERINLEWYKYDFKDNYLFNFLYWISEFKTHNKSYYFKFSENIKYIDLKYLLKSFKQNSDYLFTNIAIWSYYQHNQELNLSYKFYLNSLTLDKNNPYILARLAILFSNLWWENNLPNAEKTMKKVINLLPDIPWVNAWYWEILNKIWKYTEALSYFEKYEELTENKHRTFEPFMRKAESYIWLWNFKKARLELDKEKKYYLWEWYRFVYNDLDKKLKSLGY